MIITIELEIVQPNKPDARQELRVALFYQRITKLLWKEFPGGVSRFKVTHDTGTEEFKSLEEFLKDMKRRRNEES